MVYALPRYGTRAGAYQLRYLATTQPKPVWYTSWRVPAKDLPTWTSSSDVGDSANSFCIMDGRLLTKVKLQTHRGRGRATRGKVGVRVRVRVSADNGVK